MGNVSNNLTPFFVHLTSVFAELKSAGRQSDKGEWINLLYSEKMFKKGSCNAWSQKHHDHDPIEQILYLGHALVAFL
jgi:hypothetical protein